MWIEWLVLALVIPLGYADHDGTVPIHRVRPATSCPASDSSCMVVTGTRLYVTSSIPSIKIGWLPPVQPVISPGAANAPTHVSVSYAFVEFIGRNGPDFVGQSGSLVWQFTPFINDTQAKYISIGLKPDSVYTGDRVFVLRFIAGTGALLPQDTVITIVENMANPLGSPQVVARARSSFPFASIVNQAMFELNYHQALATACSTYLGVSVPLTRFRILSMTNQADGFPLLTFEITPTPATGGVSESELFFALNMMALMSGSPLQQSVYLNLTAPGLVSALNIPLLSLAPISGYCGDAYTVRRTDGRGQCPVDNTTGFVFAIGTILFVLVGVAFWIMIYYKKVIVPRGFRVSPHEDTEANVLLGQANTSELSVVAENAKEVKSDGELLCGFPITASVAKARKERAMNPVWLHTKKKFGAFAVQHSRLLYVLVFLASCFVFVLSVVGLATNAWVDTFYQAGLWEINGYRIKPNCRGLGGFRIFNGSQCSKFESTRAFAVMTTLCVSFAFLCCAAVVFVPTDVHFMCRIVPVSALGITGACFHLTAAFFGLIAVSAFADFNSASKGYSFALFTVAWVLSLILGCFSMVVHRVAPRPAPPAFHTEDEEEEEAAGDGKAITVCTTKGESEEDEIGDVMTGKQRVLIQFHNPPEDEENAAGLSETVPERAVRITVNVNGSGATGGADSERKESSLKLGENATLLITVCDSENASEAESKDRADGKEPSDDAVKDKDSDSSGGSRSVVDKYVKASGLDEAAGIEAAQGDTERGSDGCGATAGRESLEDAVNDASANTVEKYFAGEDKDSTLDGSTETAGRRASGVESQVAAGTESASVNRKESVDGSRRLSAQSVKSAQSGGSRKDATCDAQQAWESSEPDADVRISSPAASAPPTLRPSRVSSSADKHPAPLSEKRRVSRDNSSGDENGKAKTLSASVGDRPRSQHIGYFVGRSAAEEEEAGGDQHALEDLHDKLLLLQEEEARPIHVRYAEMQARKRAEEHRKRAEEERRARSTVHQTAQNQEKLLKLCARQQQQMEVLNARLAMLEKTPLERHNEKLKKAAEARKPKAFQFAQQAYVMAKNKAPEEPYPGVASPFAPLVTASASPTRLKPELLALKQRQEREKALNAANAARAAGIKPMNAHYDDDWWDPSPLSGVQRRVASNALGGEAAWDAHQLKVRQVKADQAKAKRIAVVQQKQLQQEYVKQRQAARQREMAMTQPASREPPPTADDIRRIGAMGVRRMVEPREMGRSRSRPPSPHKNPFLSHPSQVVVKKSITDVRS